MSLDTLTLSILVADGAATQRKLRTFAISKKWGFTLQTKWLERSGKMNTGTIIKKIKTEIKFITLEFKAIKAIFGFGSFFRNEKYNDIDILIVTDVSDANPLKTYYSYKTIFDDLSLQIGKTIDVTTLNYQEFLDHPLRESDNLTTLYSNP